MKKLNIADFTMNGKAEWVFMSERAYADELGGNLKTYTFSQVQKYVQEAKERKPLAYPDVDEQLYSAIDTYGLRGDVLIIGSVNPKYEGLAIANNGHAFTLEYGKLESKHSRLTIVGPDNFEDRKYDYILNISSIEHDGLGRYGDPICHDADLTFMKRLINVLKPGGIHYLAVPTGKDQVLYNWHRVYGPVRLALLTEGWEVKAILPEIDFNYDEGKHRKAKTGRSHQPVIVLSPEK